METGYNQSGFFSGITEDYSHYRWYKGETENPYQGDKARPLAARFWEYERDFHFSFLDQADTSADLSDAYNAWKTAFLADYLPGKSPNPYGDGPTDWEKSFETGKREIREA